MSQVNIAEMFVLWLGFILLGACGIHFRQQLGIWGSSHKGSRPRRAGRIYSARSALAGEVPLARNAGTRDATSAANASTPTDTAVTPKLYGLVPYS
jgi:hypothetical protein